MKSMLLAVAALLLNAAMVAEEAQETLLQGRAEAEQEVAETPAQAAAEMTAEAEEHSSLLHDGRIIEFKLIHKE